MANTDRSEVIHIEVRKYKHFINDATKLENLFKQEKFVYINNNVYNKRVLLDTESKIIWWVLHEESTSKRSDIELEIKKLNAKNPMMNWDFPMFGEMENFALKQNNPFIKMENKTRQMFNKTCWYLKDYTFIGLSNLYTYPPDGFINPNDYSSTIIVSHYFINLNYKAIIKIFEKWQNSGWFLQTTSDKIIKIITPNTNITNNVSKNNNTETTENKTTKITKTTTNIPDKLKPYIDIDYNVCRLPKLKLDQLTDPNKGLWELYGKKQQELNDLGIRARNPADDVKPFNVCIDFGTTSTVVAFDDNGKSKLLRIGISKESDYLNEIEAKQFENPTILEFIDFKQFISVWNKTAYRPNINWNWVRSSHEALNILHKANNDAIVIGSFINKIKQLAQQQYNLSTNENTLLRINDQINNYEYNIAKLEQKIPVKGTLLAVNENDNLDPIELYAWFLGMNINWRSRGIFYKYYMTFPIKYPREVKDLILASFRRGLQRSLPENLLTSTQNNDDNNTNILNKFSVSELATEPLAYAVSAMDKLNLEPTESGLAYAVFDFGGGTTDFDFGYYRSPTQEEYDDGCDAVFEHIGNGGDPYLGGENIVENLAYITFNHNKNILLQNNITFIQPANADDIPEKEFLIDNTQSAKANTLTMMSRLRPLWENTAISKISGNETFKFINTNGEVVKDLQFKIPEPDLKTYLENRIENSIKEFFKSLHTAFKTYGNNNEIPEEIHILLAGNSTRSKLVQAYFEFQNYSNNIVGNNITKHNKHNKHNDKNNKNDKNHKNNDASNNENNNEKNNIIAQTMQQFINNLFGDNIPKFTIHLPLDIDKNDPYSPTAKTGVALGLLKLCPGNNIDIHYRSGSQNNTILEEAGFSFYVGLFRNKKFSCILQQNCNYNEWKLLGKPRNGVFNLFYTTLSKAASADIIEGEKGVNKHSLELQTFSENERLYIRATEPNKIEICTAESDNNLNTDNVETLNNYQQLILKQI